MKILLSYIMGLVLILSGCEDRSRWESNLDKAYDPELYISSVKALSDIVVHDIFSPPVASRIHLYPSIAAYEVMAFDTSQLAVLSLAGQVTDLDPVPAPPERQEISYPLASLEAFSIVGKALIFSEDRMDAHRKWLYSHYEDLGIPQSVFESSVAYGKVVADHILAWADKDMYKESRTFPKYTIRDDSASWKPTPPDYMEGIEPHWDRIRTMVIDSANQFIPEPPTAFDINPGSPFLDEVMEVYEIGVNLSTEQQEIAQFWDCNPYVSHHRGHVMFATKKITPGGHWIGITMIASRMEESNFTETTEAFALVSIGLFDAFISCWDEKWRSILIRPETVINQYIDEDWLPLLQTPPFPEYTSGHSVISASAGTILTSIFGDGFAFKDTTEVEYGLPMRAFQSFEQAYNEAAISRLYGGIHYMPAITNGVDQGKKVGNLVLERIQTRPEVSSQVVE